MAKRPKLPVTAASRALRAAKADCELRLYDYVERGGTAESARQLGVDEHSVIKTLVFEDSDKRPFVILMHGDREVSAKELARSIGAKSVSPCRPEIADRHTGYRTGGTSPFGLRRMLPIYVEASILELERIYINAGKRGFLVTMRASELSRLLPLQKVDVAREA
jgi:Cys-tRNA(Pro) deacylase